MAFFENFTSVIRDKWLDYFRANRTWLEVQNGDDFCADTRGRAQTFFLFDFGRGECARAEAV